MKCINCNTDNKLKDRISNNNRCLQCGHSFVFEPTTTTNAKFTDGFFQKVINDISVNNTVFFTHKQFLYFLDKVLKKKKKVSIISSIASVVLFVNVSTLLGVFFGIFLQAIFKFKNENIPLNIGFIIIMFIGLMIGVNSTNDLQYRYFKDRKNIAIILIIKSSIYLLSGIISSAIFIKSFWVYLFVVISGMYCIYLGIKRLKNAHLVSQLFLIKLDEVMTWLNNWQRINGNIEKMLPPPSETQNNESNPNINPEINAYSFDRLIVCDSAEIAQFLIANNFHFENNCAILSVNRYPENIFDTVLNMLKNNPNLIVYTLHNASPQGLKLINHLRTSENWFANQNVTIYDLGILPRQIIKNPNYFIKNSLESAEATQRLLPEISTQLTPEEIDWLRQGNYLELECFSPQKLLKIILKGIAISRLPEGQNNQNINILDVEEEGSTMMIYSVDTFG